MSKLTLRFVCTECGAVQAKWMGRCPDCGRWHTLLEEAAAPAGGSRKGTVAVPKLLRVEDVDPDARPRLATGFKEFDRVLGGGLVPGALVLLGGDPGIGKSTLVLQACARLCAGGASVLYASGEESLEQVALRARRLGGVKGDFRLLCDTSLDALAAAVDSVKPSVLVVDSVQTFATEDLPSAAGSVTQVREVAMRLMAMAKPAGMAVFLVGHVTKDGALAGPRVLEHLVDTVLTFEGERHQAFRMLRAVKNRFGGTQELGLFEMADEGLKEVEAGSEYLLARRGQALEGSAVLVTLEGSRPLLVEVQALVTPAHYGTPQRVSTGVDPYRQNVLYAVLEKRVGLALYSHDIFVAVAGGLRLEETASDLAVAVAVASSLKSRPVPEGWVLGGEIGLGGDLRAAGQAELRLREAARMGFKHALLAYEDPKSMARLSKLGITPHFVRDVDEAFRELWPV
ncbi:MAG TPA: DNA repair protein RadA [bacterium]|jgi:DNA repair protein RadA/Sms|nr:DNA repair protein RadA [bacterium]